MRTKEDIIADLQGIYSCIKRTQDNFDRLQAEIEEENSELNELSKDRMGLEKELLNLIRSEV